MENVAILNGFAWPPLFWVDYANGVMPGVDGWLFLYTGFNMVHKLFTDPRAVLGDNIAGWCRLLEERKRRVNAAGAVYLHCWAPDKFSVYPEMVPAAFKLHAQTPSQIIIDAAQCDFIIDLIPGLLKEKAKHLVFWQSDTHLTYDGFCTINETICHRLNAVPSATVRHRRRDFGVVALDLGSKFNPPITEHCHFVFVPLLAKIVYKNAVVQFLESMEEHLRPAIHVGTSVGYENSDPGCDPRSVLIFGDSYAEYRPVALTALLAETFRTVGFVWSANIDYELIDALKPDIVITESAERFINLVPDDKFNLAEYGKAAIAAFLQSHPDVKSTP